MGKIRAKEALKTSPPKPKPAKKPSLSPSVSVSVETDCLPETEFVTISTQTYFAEAGSFEDVGEKGEGIRRELEKTLGKRGKERGKRGGKRGGTVGDRMVGCPVCLERYDSQRLPICLPCGHSLCKPCSGNCLSATSVTCPLDYQTFTLHDSSLPTNFLLYHLHEGLPSGPLCEAHNSEVLGFCASDSTLLCGVCLFVHKEHEPIPLSSPLASQFSTTKQSQLSSQSQQLQCSISRWEAWVYTLETLCLSLNLTPLAINMNFMLCNELSITAGTDEQRLAAACEELNKLRATNHDFLEALREAAWEVDQLSGKYAALPLCEQLRMLVPGEVRVPDTQELLNSFSLMVHRLSYYSGQAWGNAGF